MKNLSIPLCLACMLFITAPVLAQDSKSHSIGLQFNPYMDSFLFEGTFIKPVFAARYSFNLNQHLSAGPEVSGSFVHWNSDQGDLNISNLNFGGFVRYTFLPASRIRPFMEFSPYYTFGHLKSNSIQTQEGIGMDNHSAALNVYLSPGITLYTKNRKISLDLMYKFSNKTFINDKKSVFSYRLNFNF